MPNTNTNSIHLDTISNFLRTIADNIDEKLTAVLKNNPAPCLRLQSALEYTALSGGKKLRPALMYALLDNSSPTTSTLSSAQQELLLASACAIELIHTYSIVHDDLPAMDDDDMRRGKPSCHIEFDEATAILVGDSLQSLAFELISTVLPQNITLDNLINLEFQSKQLQIISVLSQAIGHTGMVAGQSLELSNLHYPPNLKNKTETSQIELELLDKIHSLKTGKLFTACFTIAGIIDNYSQNKIILVQQLGHKLGLAFQIQDDLLDSSQSSQSLGKPADSDSERNLATYSSCMGQSQAQTILDNLWHECYKIIDRLNLNSTLLHDLVTFIEQRQA